MESSFDSLSLFLFVPADRPERFGKALSGGADAVIIDLEDAVAPSGKAAARHGLAAALVLSTTCPIFVRVNAVGTEWHDDDMKVASSVDVAGILLPKAEAASDIERIKPRLGPKKLVAIIETAIGLAAVEDIASAADRLAFGSIDYAADLGCAHRRDALLMARSRIVLAARMAGRPAPLDGVTQSLREEAEITSDTRYGASLGFGGKLLIHPAQIPAARIGMAPDERDVEWARRVVASSAEGAAVAVGGQMVDAPVLVRARQIIIAHNRSLIG